MTAKHDDLAKNAPKFVVRLYDDLHMQIQSLAKYHRRSMNAEILMALEDRVANHDLARALAIRERALTERIMALEDAISGLINANNVFDQEKAMKICEHLVV
jgi:predicted transcriptional regulator